MRTIKTRTCPVCEVAFETVCGLGVGRPQVYCSKRCAWTKNNQVRYANRVALEKVCVTCGKRYVAEVNHPSQKYCSAECRYEFSLVPRIREYVCRTCSQTFSLERGKQGRAKEQCPVCLDLRTSRMSHKRHRLAIFTRDNWMCHLCDEPIDPDLKYPARRSASIDHLIPWSRGGTNVPENLRAAHLVCNQLRGTGAAPQKTISQRVTFT